MFPSLLNKNREDFIFFLIRRCFREVQYFVASEFLVLEFNAFMFGGFYGIEREAF